MPDLSLEVLIKTLADVHGADAVAASLAKVRGETTEGAAATEKLSRVTEELGQKEGEASAFTETLHHNHRALHQILHVIGNESAPGMGHALGAMLMGPIGIALALAFAYETIKKNIDKTSEAADKLAEEDLKEHQDAVTNIGKEWDDAKSAVAKYYAAMQTAGSGEDQVKKDIDNIKAQTTARLDGIQKVTEALQKQELAYARAHGATPQQVADIEERQRRELGAIETQKQGVNEAALEDEQRRRQAAGPALQAAANAALAAASEANSKKTIEGDELTSSRAFINGSSASGKENVDKREAAAKALEDLHSNSHMFEMSLLGEQGVVQLRADEKKQKNIIEEANRQDELHKKRIEQLEADEMAVKEDADKKQTLADKATQLSENNQKRLTELPAEIAQAKAIQDIQTSAQATVDKTTGESIVGGRSVQENDQIVSQGAEAVAAIKNLVADTGESAATITQRGQTAEQLRGSGQGYDQADLSNYEKLLAAQQQVQAMEDLLNALSYNSRQVTAFIATAVTGLRTSQEIHVATAGEMAAINIKLIAVQQQIAARGFKSQQ